MKCSGWSEIMPVKTLYDSMRPVHLMHFSNILSMLSHLSLYNWEIKINPHRCHDNSIGKRQCISLPELLLKVPWTGRLQQQKNISCSLSLEVWDEGASSAALLWVLSLWRVDGPLLTMSSCGLAFVHAHCWCPSLSFWRCQSHWTTAHPTDLSLT